MLLSICCSTFSCFTRALKKGERVYLLGLEQSFGHYHSVGLKLGLNLLKAREQGTLVFYEGLKKMLELSAIPSPSPLSSASPGVSSLQGLYREVLAGLGESRLLLLDNLSLLSCLGHSVQAVAAFIHHLRLALRARYCSNWHSAQCTLHTAATG